MKKDVIITFTAEFLVLITGILVYKFAAVLFGKAGFSEYALSRRTVSLIQPAILVGLGVGIPRYIAFARSSLEHKKADTYFAAGFVVLFLTTVAAIVTLNVIKETSAYVFFGNRTYDYLVFPISMMLAGLIFHASCYGYFRGRMLMLRANLLQIINMAVVPVVAFYLSGNVIGVLALLGILWFTVSTFFFFSIIRNLRPEKRALLPCAKELLYYGIQRIPADFGMAALLTIPATLTAHIAGINEAGDVAFGISILNMAGAAFAPIGLVLLPRISQLMAERDTEKINYYIMKLLKLTAVLSLAGVVIFELFADRIIHLYLGKNFINTALIARIIMAGAVAYTVYVSMRSIIDAYYVKAVNALNIFISLLIFLILGGGAALYAMNYIYVTVSLTVALFVLGGLTMLEVRKILNKKDHAL